MLVLEAELHFHSYTLSFKMDFILRLNEAICNWNQTRVPGIKKMLKKKGRKEKEQIQQKIISVILKARNMK